MQRAWRSHYWVKDISFKVIYLIKTSKVSLNHVILNWYFLHQYWLCQTVSSHFAQLVLVFFSYNLLKCVVFVKSWTNLSYQNISFWQIFILPSLLSVLSNFPNMPTLQNLTLSWVEVEMGWKVAPPSTLKFFKIAYYYVFFIFSFYLSRSFVPILVVKQMF